MDLLLAQRERRAGPHLARRSHRPHHDDAEFRCQRLTAARVVHQGDRHMDVCVPHVRLLCADRVRRGECADEKRHQQGFQVQIILPHSKT